MVTEGAIRALVGPEGEGVAHFRPEVREGYLLAIEEAVAAARQVWQVALPSGRVAYCEDEATWDEVVRLVALVVVTQGGQANA